MGLPGKPLSFCVNGGRCLKEVTNKDDHAGCDCPANWNGPHCELHDDIHGKKEENKNKGETTELLETSLSESNSATISSSSSSSSASSSSSLFNEIFLKFLITLGFVVTVLVMIACVD